MLRWEIKSIKGYEQGVDWNRNVVVMDDQYRMMKVLVDNNEQLIQKQMELQKQMDDCIEQK